MITALKDRTHHGHYWYWIMLSWSAAALIGFPAILLSRQAHVDNLILVIGAAPILAHAYALLANLGALKRLDEPHRVGPALTGASYGLGIICSMNFVPSPEALFVPYIGVFASMLSISTLFPGLAPLLAFAITKSVLSKKLSHLSVLVCLTMLTVGWVVSALNVSRIF